MSEGERFYIKDLQPIRELCLNSEKEDIYKYIYSLQQENKQLKEIIEKVREYIKENRLFMFEYDYDEYIFLGISDKEPRKELLQILDKVGESNE